MRRDAIYSSTAHDGAGASGSTSILGGTASALYHFSAPQAQARPYALGGLGMAFAEARYISIQTNGSSATLVPITAGLMFGY